MMALDPQRRFQTPSQLLEAIRTTRRELGPSGGKNSSEPQIRTVFVVEKNERLQNALRAKFKELGYRVFISTDPNVALNRYRQRPFDAIVLRAGSSDVGSVYTFERIMIEAASHKAKLAGILLLAEGQEAMGEEVKSRPGVTVMVRPVTLSQVAGKLAELVPLQPSAHPENVKTAAPRPGPVG
jgi:CheY-like chemotaxis protein